MTPPPVDRAVIVPLPPHDAFVLFTAKMRLWWPFVGHSIADEDALVVEFEPRAGGAVTEVAKSGDRRAWGTLDAWDPPRGFAMRWHPGLAEHEATRLAVTFTAEGRGTRVRVVHDGWEARGADAQAKREQYDHGWPSTLSAFAAYAVRTTLEDR